VGHAQGKIRHGGWLFPGLDPTDHVTARQLNRAVHLAAATSDLRLHALRPRDDGDAGFLARLLDSGAAGTMTTLEHRRSTRRWTWRAVGCCVRRLVSVYAGSAKSCCRIEVAHGWGPAATDGVSMLSRRLPTRDASVEQSP
jgi:hypothetical protein